ncbi:MAG: hypothetical protein MZV63_53990 [Marinilabiliales bacterium]|nr:hypothetical protein [Marinilabiliales bacterium]
MGAMGGGNTVDVEIYGYDMTQTNLLAEQLAERVKKIRRRHQRRHQPRQVETRAADHP